MMDNRFPDGRPSPSLTTHVEADGFVSGMDNCEIRIGFVPRRPFVARKGRFTRQNSVNCQKIWVSDDRFNIFWMQNAAVEAKKSYII